VEVVIAERQRSRRPSRIVLADFESSMIGTIALVPADRRRHSCPGRRSGGVMDGRGLPALRSSHAVQMARPFLPVKGGRFRRIQGGHRTGAR